MKGAPANAQPLVAVVARVPLLCEALSGALEGVAEVQGFPALQGDTDGLLRSLRPDAIVVDAPEEAEAAAPFAREARSPLVYISLTERKLRVLRNGGWEETDNGAATTDEVRNLLIRGLFRRGDEL